MSQIFLVSFTGLMDQYIDKYMNAWKDRYTNT